MLYLCNLYLLMLVRKLLSTSLMKNVDSGSVLPKTPMTILQSSLLETIQSMSSSTKQSTGKPITPQTVFNNCVVCLILMIYYIELEILKIRSKPSSISAIFSKVKVVICSPPNQIALFWFYQIATLYGFLLLWVKL